jgi:N-acetylglucosaminyldiphosphoundecaprenol N-acetyl-beta-D-mannosaminyltransferase
MKLGELKIVESKEALKAIPDGKTLINTVNAHSFNTAQKDELFAEALRTVDSGQLTVDNECVKYLIPDGASIIQACKFLKAKSQPKERIAGWDLFVFEMQRLESKRLEVRG